ncbi:hypothetical protein BKA67DRAFT_558575 [Truncatella angustata]|uniref:Uncharacterized protein n=1 Tax=Truncatella angustata TaxID=152316 RepID=A0A9P9A0P2_9PEZI|nr:uncharacterized protein BKA67DRAFT_558575 [Truncatella angustata]KAH6658622.1 hypothetical protein BKA67DRAFT_558575 [Truncatella angustata]
MIYSRSVTDCPVGSSFYTCNKNSFYGCCSWDPCDAVEGCLEVSSPVPTPTARSTSFATSTLFVPETATSIASAFLPKSTAVKPDNDNPQTKDTPQLHKSLAIGLGVALISILLLAIWLVLLHKSRNQAHQHTGLTSNSCAILLPSELSQSN